MRREYAEASSDSEHVTAGARAAWLAETAWLAVLAGDIDDLHQHLVEEEGSRER